VAKSRQSTRLFLRSSELGPPSPLPQRVCPPFGSGADKLTCGKVGGGAQIGRGERHFGTLGIDVFCGVWDPNDTSHMTTVPISVHPTPKSSTKVFLLHSHESTSGF
jgi:hypothetical protein